jgi:hypothetical protein
MNPLLAPLSWFRNRSDAECVQSTLKSSGIDSTIRAADDPPPGWRTNTAEGGVNLWVDRAGIEQAEDIIWQNASASAQMLCETCNRNSATVHVTVHRDGVQSTRNLCQTCYYAEG